MSKIFAGIVSLFISSALSAQAPIVLNGKVSFFDSNGVVLNQGMFKRATQFSEGIAAVDASHNDEPAKWFFISEAYRVKIPYGYDTVGLFSSGLCPVKKGDNWFYIGTDGLIRFDRYFYQVSNFTHGYARVRDDANESWYLINASGERVSSPLYSDVSLCANSSFGAKPVGSEFWVLVSLRNEVLLSDSFYSVAPSKEGIICVNRLGGYRYIDLQGNILMGRAFIKALPFSEGFGCVQIENEWRLIDAKGEIKKDVRLKEGVVLRGAVTPAINYNGKPGLLNRSGNWIYRLP